MKFNRYILVILDVFLVILSFYMALLLRFEWIIPAEHMERFIQLLPVIAALFALSFIVVDLYNRLWEYASIQELLVIIKAVSVGMVVLLIAVYVVNLVKLPRTVFVMSWIIGIFLIGSSRLWWRLVREYLARRAASQRVIVIGASEAGILAARMQKAEIIGFVDNEKRKQKAMIMGIPVIGTIDQIDHLVALYDVDEVVVANGMKGAELRRLIRACKDLKVVVKVIEPSPAGITPRLRQINHEDLLGREPVDLDLESISGYLNGRTVLVTGAGGSIGSELCRQIALFDPKCLITVDNSENNLFELEIELRRNPDLSFQPVLLDIKNEAAINQLFSSLRPEVVFHAAAYKHVPMMERFPHQAWENNVNGTWNILNACLDVGVERFVLISTDKAVDPANVMGASKRMCELMVSQAAERATGKYAAVRFGNVLGSRGSVIPIFQKQIEEGGPVTVTHPEMTRYFMTIKEAVQLVIQAGAFSQGGEIFVLDMGEPVNILELAEDLVRLSGLTPGKDVEISITGCRPGEKLEEELFSDSESLTKTRHDRIMVLQNGRFDQAEYEALAGRFFTKPQE